MANQSIDEKIRAASDTALDFVYEEVYGGRGLVGVGVEVIGSGDGFDLEASDEVVGLYAALADAVGAELERRRLAKA